MDWNRGTSEPAALIDLLGEWSATGGPLYRRLAEALTRALRSGDLRAGDLLPPERRLADALSVSRATVVAAYDELRAAGLFDTRRGSGTRVSAKASAQRAPEDGRVRGGRATAVVQRLVTGPPDVIALGQAAETGGPDLAEALFDVAREDLPGLVRDAGYHPAGLPALRAAIADHHGVHGLPTVPEQVVVTTGATQAVTLIARMYLGRGSTALVESPGWPGCLDTLRAAGARLVGVALDSDGIRIDRLAARLLPGLAAFAPERERLRRERLATMTRLLGEHLPDWRWQPPQAGSVLWIRLPPGTGVRGYAQLALRHGAEVVPGDTMDPGGAHDDFLRLPYAFPPETARELVTRLAAAWAARR